MFLTGIFFGALMGMVVMALVIQESEYEKNEERWRNRK